MTNTRVIHAVLLSCVFATNSMADDRNIEHSNASSTASGLQRQVDELATQLEALQRQLDELERMEAAAEPDGSAKESVAPAAANASEAAPADQESVGDEPEAELLETVGETNVQLLAGEGRSDPYADNDFAKSVPLFGSDWRLGFGGYAKVDLLYDFSGTGNDKEFVLATIPVDGDPPLGSYYNLQARETRFHFETRNTASKYAKDRFYLEFDFFDDNQSPTTVRLRHAYFEYGRLLAGRTWTLLTELRALPLFLDFAAGDSILGGRTVQIRWTTIADSQDFGWAVAVEKFNDGAIYNPSDLAGEARADLPRLTGGFTRIWPRVVWSVGAAVTQLRFDGDGAQGVGDDTDAAYTVTTAGRVYVDDSKQNYLGYSVGYQSGSITDVIVYANGGVPNAAIDAEGNLEIAKAWNTSLGLHWTWSQTYSSNFGLAYAELTDTPELFDPDFISTGWSFHGNLIYKHDERLSAGLEYMYGVRENVSGSDGDAQRLQFSLFYYF